MSVPYVCETVMQALTCSECGILFGIPGYFQVKAQEDGRTFYCPNGHKQAYIESAIKRLEREKAQLVARLDQEKAASQSARDQRDHVERRLKATKGVVTRIKNRTVRGVCPCCEATFPDLELHMKEHHPEYEGKDDTESEESK